MRIIGITGSSGSGKTTVSKILDKRKDTKVINADKIAKELTSQNSEYLLEIKNAFEKEKIFFSDGTLNRAKLAQLIYENKEDLKKLNKITYKILVPKILNEIKNVTNQIENVIIDAPLLFESCLDKKCDIVITLDSTEKLKIKRICQRDKITEDIAKKRLKIQQTNEFYIQKSDYVIKNDENTTVQDLEKQINSILEIDKFDCALGKE